MHIFCTTVGTEMFLPFAITLAEFYNENNIYYMRVE